MNIWELLKYVFLGALQGITEILPVSSSGHLALFQSILGVNSGTEATFAVFVHFASLLALTIFFWPIIWRIIEGSFLFVFKKKNDRKNDFMLAVYLVIATIPAGILGVLFEDLISSLFSDLVYVGIGFLFTSTLMFILPLLSLNKKNEYSFKNTFVVGLFQIVGILPGVSRSGVTLFGGKLMGLEEKKAKEFAFLLFLPVAFGSFILSLDDLSLILSLPDTSLLLYFSLAMVVTIIATYLSLVFIFKKFNLKNTRIFAYYLLALGIFTIIYYFI
jgi:undecaprenyl-diphosphatase